jgi:copper chaperone CopZ
MKATVSKMLLAGAVALVLGSGVALAQQPHDHDHTCVLVTKNMCCAHESVPAIKEMSKVPGVARVVADHKTRSLTIIPKENVMPSPLALWTAAERAKLEVVTLNTAHGVYKSKPKVRR